MNRYVYVIHVCLWYLLLTCVHSKECMTGQMESKSVYVNDEIYYDLSLVSTGSGLAFTLGDDYGKSARIRETFEALEKPQVLDKDVKACTAYASLNNSLFAYVCDGHKVLVVNYNTVDGTMTSSNTVQLDASFKCKSLSTNHYRFVIYAVCLHANEEGTVDDLVVVAVDPVTFTFSEPVVLKQDEPHAILNNIKSYVYIEKTEKRYTSLIYIYEDVEFERVRFAIVKQNYNGGISTAGLFSSTVNIMGVDKESKFLGVKSVNSSLLLVLRDKKKNSIYFQECYPSPVLSHFHCIPDDTGDTGNTLEAPLVEFHRRVNGHLYDVDYISITNPQQLSLYTFSTQDYRTLSEVVSVDLSRSYLSQVQSSYLYDDRVYITGKTKEGYNVIVLFRITTKSWEEKVFKEGSPYDISHVRQGTYDTDIDEHIAVSGNTAFISLINRPALIVVPSEIDGDSSRIEVKCSIRGATVNTAIVNIEVVRDLSLGFFGVPDKIEAYTESRSISVPVCSDDFFGNAPQFEVRSATKGVEIKSRIEYSYAMDKVVFDGKEIKNAQEMFYIGQGLYMVIDDLSMTVISCITESDREGVCVEVGKTQFTNRIVLDSASVGDKIYTLEAAYKLSTVGKPIYEDLTLQVRSTKDLSSLKLFTFKGYRANIGEIKIWGETLYALVVGFRPEEVLTQRLMWSKMSITDEEMDKDFSNIMKVEDHICVKELKFIPRSKDRIYLSSSCDDVLTTRIYEIDINSFMRNPEGNVMRIFSELGTTDYNICPTGGDLIVIDNKNGRVFAIDTRPEGAEDTKYFYPFKEYGVDSIVHSHCDQENRVVQVIGANKEKTVFKVITYLGERHDTPLKRVHSVNTLPDSTFPSFIASTYNYVTDEINTIVMGQYIKQITMYRLFIGAPLIYLDAQQVKAAGLVEIEYLVKFESTEFTNTLVFKQELVFSEQLVNVSLKGKNKPLPSKSSTLLDDQIEVTGPVISFSMTGTSSVVLFDRLYPSDQFRRITRVFENSVYDHDLVFGYASNTLYLYEGNEEVMVIEKREAKIMTSIGNSEGFFALTHHDGGIFAEILAVVKVKGAWKYLTYSLGSSTIEDMVFFRSIKGLFFFAAFDNESNNVMIGLLGLGESGLSFIQEILIHNNGNIIDFDAIRLNQNDDNDLFLVISCEEQTRLAKYNLLKVSNGKMNVVGRLEDSLIPGIKAIHNQVDFSCTLVKDSKNKVDCIHIEENLYNYVVRYTIETENPSEAQRFAKGQIIGKVRNIRNFRPIRSAIYGNFSAVIVENLNPVTKEQSIFSEKHLLLIYNPVYQLDPYKVVTHRELGLKQSNDLVNLYPSFFVNQVSGELKLGVNVGVEGSSIRVFNLDLLRLVVNDPYGVPVTTKLIVEQIEGENQAVLLSELLAFPDPPSPTPEKDKKVSPVVYGIIILVLSLLVIIGIILYLKRVRGENATNENEEKLLKTRIEGDGSTIKTIQDDASSINTKM